MLVTSTTDATRFSKTSWLLCSVVVRQSTDGPLPANNLSESGISPAASGRGQKPAHGPHLLASDPIVMPESNFYLWLTYVEGFDAPPVLGVRLPEELQTIFPHALKVLQVKGANLAAVVDYCGRDHRIHAPNHVALLLQP